MVSTYMETLAAKIWKICRFIGPKRQFMPQMPGLLHIPPGQDGTSERDGVAPFACAEKVEYCCFRRFCPQEGQFTSEASAARRTSFSNLVLQSSHWYS